MACRRGLQNTASLSHRCPSYSSHIIICLSVCPFFFKRHRCQHSHTVRPCPIKSLPMSTFCVVWLGFLFNGRWQTDTSGFFRSLIAVKKSHSWFGRNRKSMESTNFRTLKDYWRRITGPSGVDPIGYPLFFVCWPVCEWREKGGVALQALFSSRSRCVRRFNPVTASCQQTYSALPWKERTRSSLFQPSFRASFLQGTG